MAVEDPEWIAQLAVFLDYSVSALLLQGKPMSDQRLQSAMLGLQPLHYERRIVSFFDVLGWKRHIEAATGDPIRLAQMNLVLHMFSVFEPHRGLNGMEGARISTFSDNVVVSVPYKEDRVAPTLAALARTQVGFAISGFLLRGAVTVGDLWHVPGAVFGPALVAAAEAEKKARFPRILIDQAAPELVGIEGELIGRDSASQFLDPFQPAIIDSIVANQLDVSAPLAALEASVGFQMPDFTNLSFTGISLLHALLSLWSSQMIVPMRQRDWEKLAWIFDRVAARVGVETRASNLPRSVVADPTSQV